MERTEKKLEGIKRVGEGEKWNCRDLCTEWKRCSVNEDRGRKEMLLFFPDF